MSLLCDGEIDGTAATSQAGKKRGYHDVQDAGPESANWRHSHGAQLDAGHHAPVEVGEGEDY